MGTKIDIGDTVTRYDVFARFVPPQPHVPQGLSENRRRRIGHLSFLKPWNRVGRAGWPGHPESHVAHTTETYEDKQCEADRPQHVESKETGVAVRAPPGVLQIESLKKRRVAAHGATGPDRKRAACWAPSPLPPPGARRACSPSRRPIPLVLKLQRPERDAQLFRIRVRGRCLGLRRDRKIGSTVQALCGANLQQRWKHALVAPPRPTDATTSATGADRVMPRPPCPSVLDAQFHRATF